MAEQNRSDRAREKRHQRVRVRVSGTAERPRLNVFRSLRHMYAQLIDDLAGHTMASASTMDAEIKEQLAKLSRADQAKLVGQVLAKRGLEKGVKQVVFDRGGYKYHGRVKALAESARAAGLQF